MGHQQITKGTEAMKRVFNAIALALCAPPFRSLRSGSMWVL